MSATESTGSTTWGAGRLSPEAAARFLDGLAVCDSFFKGQAEVQKALRKLTSILEADGVSYAVIGALALNEYGHRRVTVDVDLLLSEADLAAFKSRHLGRGYAEREPGTGKLFDTEHGVNIDVLSAGNFPGDGRPKPIAFPDPASVSLRGPGFRLLPLPRFLELKLASGMTAPHRLRDLADVIDLVRSAGLPLDLAQDLHPWVRDKYTELWNAAQGEDPY